MTEDLRTSRGSMPFTLQVLPADAHLTPSVPAKRINDGEDLSFFFASKAYAEIVTFLLQLNRSMIPILDSNNPENVHAWPIDSPKIPLSPNVSRIKVMIESLQSLMETAPPETGPRRFGNAAFRTWFAAVQHGVPKLLKEALSDVVWTRAQDQDQPVLQKELEAYLVGSFGSAERLDYGTGHELSFLAFLGCIWKLGGFSQAESGVEERAIVVGIIHPYLELVRRLILTYTLEPAGSHGVWGLDDHSFLPYILGSAQYCPPMQPNAAGQVPTEGSLQDAPSPDCIAKHDWVERYRSSNLYFSAIGFIFDVKKGPFWEHSPTLYDISGIKDGWAKINKGMIKMYNAEVLSKFPVVQHFPFGSLFRWERDASAAAPAVSPHARAQPRASGMSQSSMKAPRASAPAAGNMLGSTAAPWASTARPVGKPGGTATPWAQPMSATSASMTRGAPGAAAGRPSNTSSMPPSTYSNVTSSQRR